MAQKPSKSSQAHRNQSGSMPHSVVGQPSRPDFDRWAVAVREQMLAVLAKSSKR